MHEGLNARSGRTEGRATIIHLTHFPLFTDERLVYDFATRDTTMPVSAGLIV